MTTSRSLALVRWVALAAAVIAIVVVGTIGIASRPAAKSASALASNPDLDSGTTLAGATGALG